MEDEDVVRTKQHTSVWKDSIHHQDNNSLRDSGQNIKHYSPKGELTVNCHTENVKAKFGQYYNTR